MADVDAHPRLVGKALQLVLPRAGNTRWPTGVTGELRISPFKPLPQALRITGAELVETRSGPLGMVSALENREVPFRGAPGLSLLARAPVPEQVTVFVDADGPLAIVRHDASSPPPAYLADLTSALPYRLVESPKVLVLGARGGAAVLQALAAFLLFAGAGSYLSARRSAGVSITGSVIGIAVIATTCALISHWLIAALIGAPPAVKIAAAFALIAPLATLMGMPFPRALARLNAVDPSLLPWAWGINGCALVIGAVFAALLAIYVGHTVVILVGVVLYAAAAAFVARMAPRRA